MFDRFESHASGLESPATTLVAVTPDDATDLLWVTRAIAVSGTGMVARTTVDGSTGAIHIAAGASFPIRARRILATGTTATGITALA